MHALKMAFESFRKGDLAIAEALCKEALNRNPSDCDALHLYALVKKEQKDSKTSFTLMNSIFDMKKNDPFYLNNLALILIDQGETEKASTFLKQALVIDPYFIEAYQNLGYLYLQKNSPEKAILYLMKALKIKPDHIPSLLNMVRAYRKKKEYPKSIEFCHHILSLSLRHAKAHHYLANNYKDMGKLNDAITHYSISLSFTPEDIALLNDFGNTLIMKGSPEKAIPHFQKAIDIEPLNDISYINLGNAYKYLSRMDFAEKCYQKALSINPLSIEAHFNLGVVYLIRQKFEKGFTEYEWRLRWLDGYKDYPHRFGRPLWKGEPLDGKSLLIYDEQGFGDVFLFLRFIDQLNGEKTTILFETRPPLIPLLKNHPKIDSVINRSMPIETPPPVSIDFCIPIASLPKFFIKTTKDITFQYPYIIPDPSALDKWKDSIRSDPFNIGLIWRGSRVDPNRICPLSEFLPLSDIPQIKMYGLQIKSENSAESIPNAVLQINFGDRLSNFSDTAALIHQLDLIISIDTAGAHLAGAMGKPVWVLLPAIADWRWFEKGENTPWYPTMRLFRQKDNRNWSEQIKSIKRMLIDLIKKNEHPIPEADPHIQKGEEFCRVGRIEDAVNYILRAIEASPSSILHYYLSKLFYLEKRLTDAIFHSLKAIGFDPLFTEAFFFLANIFHEQGKLSLAECFYDHTLRIHPHHHQAWFNRGMALQAAGRFSEAKKSYETAVIIKPDFSEAYNNLGLLLHGEKKLKEAIQTFRTAIATDPSLIRAYQNIGNVYIDLKKFDRVIAWYQKALKREPKNALSAYHFGQLLNDHGRTDRAIRAFRKAIDIDAGFCSAHMALSISLLRKGLWKEGWEHFEWRFKDKTREVKTYPYIHGKGKWNGERFHGKRLLVHCEQGLGDTIQFSRFLPKVKERGGDVLFEVQKSLAPLFKTFKGVDRLLILSPFGKTSEKFDIHIPLLSTPRVLEIRREDIETPQPPYLFPDEKKSERWEKKLRREDLNVGVVWQGNMMHKNDSQRSLSPDFFEKFLNGTGIKLIGFQKWVDSSSKKEGSNHISFENWGESFIDFSDTAAALNAVDLIISVDTAVAHLAGAIGKPVFLLLPHTADWRWFEKGSTTPWYPSVKLFRQRRKGDWEAVMSELEQHVLNLMKNRR